MAARVAAGGDGARAGSSFSPIRSFLRDVRRCNSINTRRASDADKTGRGDGRGGGRRGGNIQAWPYAPLSWHVWGIMGWKKARGNVRWPGFSYCGEAEISLLPWMRLLPCFRGSREHCRHSGRRFCKDHLPQHCLLKVGMPGGILQALPISPRCCAGPKRITSPGTWHPACISHFIPSSPATLTWFWCLHPGMHGPPDHMHKEDVTRWRVHSVLPIIQRHLPRGALSSTSGADPPISRLATIAGQNQSGRRLPTRVGKGDFLVFAFPTRSQKGGDLFQADFRLAHGRSELGNVQTAIKSPNLKRK